MKKYKLEICEGYACRMRGGFSIETWRAKLKTENLENVDVIAQGCLGGCSATGMNATPYVRLNGVRIANADVGNVINQIHILEENDA